MKTRDLINSHYLAKWTKQRGHATNESGISMIYSVHTASFGIKIVVSNPSNREIHEQIKTNESNKFSRSGGNICEKEKVSKGQEDREKRNVRPLLWSEHHF